MNNLTTYKLSNIIELIGGGTPKTTVPEYWNGEIPWLSVVDFANGQKYVYQTEKTITKKGLNESSTKILKKGQIIISARGTVGELAVLGKDMAFNQSCYGINSNEKTENDFLYYLLKHSIGKIKKNTHGAVFDTITKQTFENIEVDLPESLEEQKEIASILSSLDDKIEINLQMNQTLEAMAQAIFKEWFVNFNFPGFDGKLVDGLPKGWKRGKLGELIGIKHGYAFKGEFFSNVESKYILLTPGNFKIGGGFNSNKFKYYIGEVPNDYVLRQNDLIVTMTDLSKDGDTLGCPAIVPVITDKILLHNQRLGKIILKNKLPLKLYLYWIMRQPEYRHFVLGSTTGSTVKHTSPTRICDYGCVIPDEKIICQFDSLVKIIIEKEQENFVENQTLAALRDSLLPKLMTGKIEIKK